ncbi:hypothetical protein HFP72_29750 [Nocardiopsis sp. ARC36]
MDVAALRKELRRRVDGEARFGPGSPAVCSTDASAYHRVPLGVVVPRDAGAARVGPASGELEEPLPAAVSGTAADARYRARRRA